jgi:hypothetical protein
MRRVVWRVTRATEVLASPPTASLGAHRQAIEEARALEAKKLGFEGAVGKSGSITSESFKVRWEAAGRTPAQPTSPHTGRPAGQLTHQRTNEPASRPTQPTRPPAHPTHAPDPGAPEAAVHVAAGV